MNLIYQDVIGADIIEKMREAGLFKTKYATKAVDEVIDSVYVLGHYKEKYAAKLSFKTKDDLKNNLISAYDTALEAGILSTTRKVNILCKACERVYMFAIDMNSKNFEIIQ